MLTSTVQYDNFSSKLQVGSGTLTRPQTQFTPHIWIRHCYRTTYSGQDRKTDLLEAGELVEEHAEHHLVGLRRQVGEEENLVGRRVVHTAHTLGRNSRTRGARLETREKNIEVELIRLSF